MGAPKIKVYQLPVGYSQARDNDVQRALNDELVPVKDKPLVPEDFYSLTGVKFAEKEELVFIDFNSGMCTEYLTPDSERFQAPESLPEDILTLQSNESFRAVVLNSNGDEIMPSGYVLSPSGVMFAENTLYPSGASIKYWKSADNNSCYAIGARDSWYDGTNYMFKHKLFSVDESHLSYSAYELDAETGFVSFLIPVPSGMTASYAYETPVTKYFIGHRENWIPPNMQGMSGGHVYMGPDIFKGMYDYPGDDTRDDNGTAIVQGVIPKYAEQAEYQIDFRKGMVTFISEFDSASLPVHASFAHLTGVRNATGQELSLISPSGEKPCVYKAVEDTEFPLSINARWVGRNNLYTPRNFYILPSGLENTVGNRELKPKLTSVTPYDVLTMKTQE